MRQKMIFFPGWVLGLTVIAVAILMSGFSGTQAASSTTWDRLPTEDEIAAATVAAETPTPGFNRVSTRVSKLHDGGHSDPLTANRVLLSVTEVQQSTWRFLAAWLTRSEDGGLVWVPFMEGAGPRGWWQEELLSQTTPLRGGWLAEADGPLVILRPPERSEPISSIGGVCASGGRAPAIVPTYSLGTPGADGANLVERLDPVTDQIAVTFKVTQPRAAQIYVGDQWYDMDLALFSMTRDEGMACWQTAGARARSERHQGRAIQLLRPDEQIIEQLEPGDYALLIGLAPGAEYDHRHDFTVRVALTPPLCGPLSPPNVANPRYPSLQMRADDAWYQLGITLDPPLEVDRGPFSLLTYSAFLSPPYRDLYEFDWRVDGVAVRDVTEPMIQEPAAHMPRPDHLHRVQVTARAVRDYPDPDQPHRPPTLTAECAFRAP